MTSLTRRSQTAWMQHTSFSGSLRNCLLTFQLCTHNLTHSGLPLLTIKCTILPFPAFELSMSLSRATSRSNHICLRMNLVFSMHSVNEYVSTWRSDNRLDAVMRESRGGSVFGFRFWYNDSWWWASESVMRAHGVIDQRTATEYNEKCESTSMGGRECVNECAYVHEFVCLFVCPGVYCFSTLSCAHLPFSTLHKTSF